METELTDLVWSQLYPKMRVRWVTPSFVRRGSIVKVKGPSMTVQFDGFDRVTVIPDARQYFCDWKMGRTDYQLVPIDDGGPHGLQGIVLDSLTEIADDIKEGLIDVKTAANILGTDPKNVRRKLRAGTLPGKIVDGHWIMTAEDIRRHAR